MFVRWLGGGGGGRRFSFDLYIVPYCMYIWDPFHIAVWLHLLDSNDNLKITWTHG